jgi:hypothetical protein
MYAAIADRVWLARSLIRQSNVIPQFRSVTAISGIPLSDIRDIETTVVDVGDVLDDLIPTVFWSYNGSGSELMGGLVCQDGGVEFILNDTMRVPLVGGVTPETLTCLLASELGYSAATVISVALFINAALALPEAVLSQHDTGFMAQIVAERRRSWPLIFPREYYRDAQNQPHDRCAPWAMGGGTPVKVGGQNPLIGCNFFLRRCQERV